MTVYSRFAGLCTYMLTWKLDSKFVHSTLFMTKCVLIVNRKFLTWLLELEIVEKF